MMRRERIPRRTFLRGLGAALALPVLDAMAPRAAAGESRGAIPCRLAFFYVPNGIHMPDWRPKEEGAGFEFPPTLKCLEPFRESLLVLTGLAQDKARPHGDGPGDHARSAGVFLTGVKILKTHGADIRAGISADQVAAAKVGGATRLPSLELGCEPGQQAGNCDSGYSCAYSSNISWKTESTPMAKEIHPRLVFERLFGGGSGKEDAAARERRMRGRKSVLDFVLDDAGRLRARLGPTDRRKLDEYLTAVREIEERIGRFEAAAPAPAPAPPPPEGIPGDCGEHIRLLCDLIVLAFRTDSTRIVTIMFANEGSNRSYKSIGVPEGHHDLSHHGGERDKLEKIARINRFHLERFAEFLGKLKASPEGDGTLLDRSMVVYGSGLGDGNRHNHDDLPILLAGGGCGTIRGGRHVVYSRETPLNNLYLSLLDRMDAGPSSLGDSTGRLPGLTEAS